MEILLHLVNDHRNIESMWRETEEYLNSHKSLRNEVAAHLVAYREVQDLIPETAENVGSGHFFPYAESHYELESSFELCRQGFYRHSFFALRCVLELGTVGLYFDKNDRSHPDVQSWLHSQDRTPHFRNILSHLFELEYFCQFEHGFSLQHEITCIYSSLSDYVHVRGYRHSTIGQVGASYNRFNERALHRYVKLMEKVIRNLITMMLLKYPIGMQKLPFSDKFGLDAPVGGFLDKLSRSAVLAVLEEDRKDILQKISDNDPLVARTAREICTLPNFTEEQ